MDLNPKQEIQETSQFRPVMSNADESRAPNNNAFKDTFKYYRKIGVGALETLTKKQADLQMSNEWNPENRQLSNNSHDRAFFGLKPLSSWEIHRFKFPEGN